MNDDLTDATWQALAAVAREADAQTPPATTAQVTQTWRAIQARISAESLMAQGEPTMDMNQRDPAPELVTTPIPIKHTPERTTANHRIPLFSAVAAVVLVALATTIFAMHPRGSNVNPGVSVHPTATSAPTARLRNLTYEDAAVVSGNDIWALGYGNEPAGLSDGPFVSFITHFDGKHWQAAPGAYFPNVELSGISMVSATDGWAVGTQNDATQTHQRPLFVHYAQGHWIAKTLDETDIYLKQVQMLSADEGWALGGFEGGPSLFYHYQHGVWTRATTPTAVTAKLAYTAPDSATPPGEVLLQGYQFLSDTDGWAWGNSGSQSVLWHYTSGQWQIALLVPPGVPGDFLGLGANSASDVWVVGTHASAQALPSSQTAFATTSAMASERPLSSGGIPVLFHYNGQTWTQRPADISAGQSFYAGANWLDSVGQVNNQQMLVGLLHNVGGQWQPTTFPQPVDAVLTVAPQINGGAVAVVGDGPGYYQASDLHVLRYVNGTWTQVQ